MITINIFCFHHRHSSSYFQLHHHLVKNVNGTMAVFSLLQNLLCEWCQNRKQITYKHIHFVNSSVVSILSYNIHMVLIWLWQCFVYICARSFATQKLTGRKRLNGTMTLCVVFLLAQLFIVRKKKKFCCCWLKIEVLYMLPFFYKKN